MLPIDASLTGFGGQARPALARWLEPQLAQRTTKSEPNLHLMAIQWQWPASFGKNELIYPSYNYLFLLAERVRFELTSPVKGLRFSRPVQSTALPPLLRRRNIISAGSRASDLP